MGLLDGAKFLNNVYTALITCMQFGDTGKGKAGDLLAEEYAHVFVRAIGGANAGNSAFVNGKLVVYHLMPIGAAHLKEGKIGILGPGVVIHPQTLLEEIAMTESLGVDLNDKFFISHEAHITLPMHVEMDAGNKKITGGGIGSTGKGIGPTYSDRVARRGIPVAYLYSKRKLSDSLDNLLKFYPQLGFPFDKNSLMNELTTFGRKISPYVSDTRTLLRKIIRDRKLRVLISGSQGALLSNMSGPYPYVTGSDTTLNGIASGAGISAQDIDLVLGVMKFPYMTKVGGGPFPTEYGGKISDDRCADFKNNNKLSELEEFNIPYSLDGNDAKYDPRHENIISLMNREDPLLRGIGLRLAGIEYGATTGRPRRTGMFDLEAAEYALDTISVKRPLHVILTKLDVVRDMENIEISIGYSGGHSWVNDAGHLSELNPVVKTFKGFSENISGVRDEKDLPDGLREAINYIKNTLNIDASMIGVGQNKENIIIDRN